MRAAPAVSIESSAPPEARVAVGLIGFFAMCTTLVWAGASGGGLLFGVPLVSLALTLHLLAELHAVPRRRLRWDGFRWGSKPGRPGADERCGDVSVAIDLGGFLLLHFVAAYGPRDGRSVWLPLRQGHIRGDWHALRCALYSPREQADVAASEALDG
jgi:hypothetical protein